MSWGNLTTDIAYDFKFGSVGGFTEKQDQQPVDFVRTGSRLCASADSVWSCRHCNINFSYHHTGDSIISIISGACHRGRRYQIIFHNRYFFNNRTAFKSHATFFSYCGNLWSRENRISGFKGQKNAGRDKNLFFGRDFYCGLSDHRRVNGKN